MSADRTNTEKPMGCESTAPSRRPFAPGPMVSSGAPSDAPTREASGRQLHVSATLYFFSDFIASGNAPAGESDCRSKDKRPDEHLDKNTF